jgi:C-terminal processing protease CtpA/Prc
MRRPIIFSFIVVATLAALAAAEGQATGSGGTTVRVRVFSPPRDSAARARRERLLLRFDSLRYEFEQMRLSDADRDRVADEMHRTVMALQESLDDVSVRTRAVAAARGESPREAMITSPEIAIAMQGVFTPRGYIGVSFDGPNVEEVRRGGERLVRFLVYPKIALVEPGSPAEHAGIQEGDTLLAIDGSDVRQRQISLTKLLVPDQRVIVRVRREGNQKEFRVQVGEAPGYVVSRRAPMPPMAPIAPMPAMGTMTPMAPPSMSRARIARSPMPAVAATPPEMAGSVWIINEGVAGAKLESISEGLGRALGTKAGILVLRAGPGTPAYESGLRDGDVIIRADGKDVSNVRQLRSALVDADQEGVKLVIVRERKQREVTLRW